MLKRVYQDAVKRLDRDIFVISLFKDFFTGAVRFYQLFISPLKQSSCRFYPTCSSYSMQAFERYGVFRGVCLTLKRLLKCHPFHQGGYDPLQ